MQTGDVPRYSRINYLPPLYANPGTDDKMEIDDDPTPAWSKLFFTSLPGTLHDLKENRDLNLNSEIIIYSGKSYQLSQAVDLIDRIVKKCVDFDQDIATKAIDCFIEFCQEFDYSNLVNKLKDIKNSFPEINKSAPIDTSPKSKKDYFSQILYGDQSSEEEVEEKEAAFDSPSERNFNPRLNETSKMEIEFSEETDENTQEDMLLLEQIPEMLVYLIHDKSCPFAEWLMPYYGQFYTVNQLVNRIEQLSNKRVSSSKFKLVTDSISRLIVYCETYNANDLKKKLKDLQAKICPVWHDGVMKRHELLSKYSSKPSRKAERSDLSSPPLPRRKSDNPSIAESADESTSELPPSQDFFLSIPPERTLVNTEPVRGFDLDLLKAETARSPLSPVGVEERKKKRKQKQSTPLSSQSDRED